RDARPGPARHRPVHARVHCLEEDDHPRPRPDRNPLLVHRQRIRRRTRHPRRQDRRDLAATRRMNPANTTQKTGDQHAPLPPAALSPFQEKPDKPQPGSTHEQPPEAANGPQPGLRALLADLSPYYDVRPLKELGPLAAEVARSNGPAILRALAAAG